MQNFVDQPTDKSPPVFASNLAEKVLQQTQQIKPMLGVKPVSLGTPKMSIDHSEKPKRRFFPHPITALQKQDQSSASGFDKKKNSAASARKLSVIE